MLEEIKGIKIDSSIFDTPKNYNFFEDKSGDKNHGKTNFAIVYGENGSGKSTISRAVKRITAGTIDENSNITNVVLIDSEGHDIKNEELSSYLLKDNIFVYNELFIDDIKFEEKGLELLIEISEVQERVRNKSRIENEIIAKTKMIELQKQDIIKKIDPEHDYENYRKALKELHKKRNELIELKIKYEDEVNALDEIILPTREINKYLKDIFLDNNRMKIKIEGDKNVIYSRNNKASPYDISTGERNILTLCYFFASVNDSLINDEEIILVLDDPISSMDKSNIIGITSFLKQQFNKISEKSDTSKVIVFTHDLEMFLKIHKITKRIKRNNKKIGVSQYTLDNFELNYLSNNKIKNNFKGEYVQMMEQVYKFARATNPEDYDRGIGNIIRRVIEAFSTFIYRKGLEEILENDRIVSSLNGDQINFFRHYILKDFLNDESHTEDAVKVGNNYSVYSIYTLEEKVTSARVVLCLMYLLQPHHLEACLSDLQKNSTKDPIDNIQLWEKEIIKYE